MHTVNVTEFINHMATYLQQANDGKEIYLTSRGQVIARLLPPVGKRTAALEQLKLFRAHCKVGDVISPIDEAWNAKN